MGKVHLKSKIINTVFQRVLQMSENSFAAPAFHLLFLNNSHFFLESVTA